MFLFHFSLLLYVLQEVFVDSGRSSLFSQVKIETALAVPVFSGRAQTPSFVFCCYSFVRSGSVPFVLKFVQQALRLLWDGLDKVQPHESVGQELWKDVAPADLGEMAADVEMHEHFIIKKRPFQSISEPLQPHNATDSSLATQLEAMHVPSGVPAVRSIYTGSGPSPSPGPAEAPASPELGPTVAPVEYQTTYETIQTHINDAIRSVGYMQPVHHHVSTNAQGSKRAHVYRAPDTDQRSQYDSVSHQTQSPANNAQHYMQSPAPSPMYQPLPLPNQIMVQRASHSDEQNQAPDHGQQSQAPTINTNLNNPYQIDQNNPYHTDPNDRYQTDPNNPYQDDPNNLYQTDEFIYQNQNQQYEPEPNPVVYEYSQQPAQLQQPLQPQPTQTQPVTYYQQETNQVGASQDYSHNASYAANTIAPAPSMNTMPMPNPVASIPIDQISATGISFPVPPNMQAKPSNGIHGGVPLAQNPAAIAPSDQYCMPTSQRSKFTNTTSVSVKVSNDGEEDMLPIFIFLSNCHSCSESSPVEFKDAVSHL